MKKNSIWPWILGAVGLGGAITVAVIVSTDRVDSEETAVNPVGPAPPGAPPFPEDIPRPRPEFGEGLLAFGRVTSGAVVVEWQLIRTVDQADRPIFSGWIGPPGFAPKLVEQDRERDAAKRFTILRAKALLQTLAGFPGV